MALLAFVAAIMAIASLRQARHIDSPAALTRFVDVIFGWPDLLLRALRPGVWICASLATIGVPIGRALDLYTGACVIEAAVYAALALVV